MGIPPALREVGIPPALRVDILNGQAALDREVLVFPITASVGRAFERKLNMTTIRTLALFIITIVAIAGCPLPSKAQSIPAASQMDSIAVHVSMQKSSYAIGKKAIVVLEINNSGSKAIWFSNDRHLERIHITRKEGEPRKTELHRHLLGDFRPGDGPALLSGPVAGRSIAPGSVDSQKYDLSYFYDLSMPGEYSVYLEIYDPSGPEDGSGHWLRTNTVQFEVTPPTQ